MKKSIVIDFFIANLSMFCILARMIQLNIINIPYSSYGLCMCLNKGFYLTIVSHYENKFFNILYKEPNN
ncbi:hypothetical protein F6I14_04735 [Staphylococcus epidermidis]|nr:hypothetical protein F6I14_04735 [Staphylococcus epidermidis]